MRKYLSNKYSTNQIFTKDHIMEELLLSAREARELMERVVESVKPIDFDTFVLIIMAGLEDS